MIDIFILNNIWNNLTYIAYISNNTKLKVKLNRFNQCLICLTNEPIEQNNKNYFFKNLMTHTQYK